jgi:GntR family transcriptional regulator/MocR family aminotransferase
MRVRYRKQRDAVVQALADALPEATVTGIAAGLHVTVRLPPSHDEQAIRAELRRRGIQLNTTSDYSASCHTGGPLLMLGYAHLPAQVIPAGVRAVADAVRATTAAPSTVRRR